MVQLRNWSEAEFTILLENPRLSDQIMANKLPGRSAEAVGQVRDMVHKYHGEAEASELRGKVAANHLAEAMGLATTQLKRGSWTCARCGKKV